MDMQARIPNTVYRCPPCLVPPARLVPSWRLVIAFTCCLGGFVAMFGRVKTSFAVICMVQDPPSSGLPPGSGNSSFDEAQTHVSSIVRTHTCL